MKSIFSMYKKLKQFFVCNKMDFQFQIEQKLEKKFQNNFFTFIKLVGTSFRFKHTISNFFFCVNLILSDFVPHDSKVFLLCMQKILVQKFLNLICGVFVLNTFFLNVGKSVHLMIPPQNFFGTNFVLNSVEMKNGSQKPRKSVKHLVNTKEFTNVGFLVC